MAGGIDAGVQVQERRVLESESDSVPYRVVADRSALQGFVKMSMGHKVKRFIFRGLHIYFSV